MVVVALLAVLFLSVASRAQDLSESYRFSATLRSDDAGNDVYKLYWNFDTQEETISFAVRVRTTGWIGFGLSPNGDMTGSDVVMGWVDGNGETVFNDRYAFERALPVVDPEQNWDLTRPATEIDGYTTLEFSRKWVTCDDRDRDIKVETARVVFSWNDNDPVDGVPEYHGRLQRGSTSLNLLGGLPKAPTVVGEVDSFSIRVSNVTIPSDTDTTYWCAAIELPQEIIDETVYVVRISPVITDNEFQYVHHIIVTQCYDQRDPATIGAEKGSVCGVMGGNIANCVNGIGLGGWAVGGEDFVMPENVGIPVGGKDNPTYIILEMHYDNPSLDAGVVDHSGMEFFFTKTFPGNIAGDFVIGYAVSPLLMIPPGVKDFTIYGLCTSTCTNSYIQPEGVKIFGNTFHTHLAGHGLELQHIRRNTECDKLEELKPIETNQQYNFNFQQTTHLQEEITLLPGDILLLKCDYSTNDRNKVTLGGDSTREEMCLSFVYHYPRSDMYYCISSLSTESFIKYALEYLSVDEVTGLDSIEYTDDLFAYFKQLSAFLSNNVTWNDENKAEGLQESYRTGTYNVFCDPNLSSDALQLKPSESFPKVDCPYQAPDVCNPDSVPQSCCMGGTLASAAISSFLLLTALTLSLVL